MDDRIICPLCGYRRKDQDNNPEWQCPGCMAAYNKAQYGLFSLPEKKINEFSLPQDMSKAYLLTEDSLYIFNNNLQKKIKKIEISENNLQLIAAELSIGPIEDEEKMLFETLPYEELNIIKKNLDSNTSTSHAKETTNNPSNIKAQEGVEEEKDPIENQGDEKKHVNSNSDLYFWVGCLGVILLLIGIFSPIAAAPMIGDLNLFRNGKGDGIFILFLSSFWLVKFMRAGRMGLTILSMLIGGLIIYDLVFTYNLIQNIKSDLANQLADNPFAGIANTMIGSIEMKWGWILLLLGASLMLLSSIVKDKDIPSIIEDHPQSHIFKNFVNVFAMILFILPLYFLIFGEINNTSQTSPSLLQTKQQHRSKNRSETVSQIKSVNFTVLSSDAEAFEHLASNCLINVKVYGKTNFSCTKASKLEDKLLPQLKMLGQELKKMGKENKGISRDLEMKLNTIIRQFKSGQKDLMTANTILSR
ncbi:hypothetical protein [Legionella septentrionalis]|uniref:hypothetical protein n=1 Tax=Legionella septentrionalis TaxID=2498109 RepID=UPI000F8E85B8|nr:hypothetical protein [Legionella septentrionalis]RUR12431.1 hypothetical protein ELY10_11560 [Legionella septentrionalis]